MLKITMAMSYSELFFSRLLPKINNFLMKLLTDVFSLISTYEHYNSQKQGSHYTHEENHSSRCL